MTRRTVWSGLILLYVAVAVAVTWPLALHLGDAIPGMADTDQAV